MVPKLVRSSYINGHLVADFYGMTIFQNLTFRRNQSRRVKIRVEFKARLSLERGAVVRARVQMLNRPTSNDRAFTIFRPA